MGDRFLIGCTIRSLYETDMQPQRKKNGQGSILYSCVQFDSLCFAYVETFKSISISCYMTNLDLFESFFSFFSVLM